MSRSAELENFRTEYRADYCDKKIKLSTYLRFIWAFRLFENQYGQVLYNSMRFIEKIKIPYTFKKKIYAKWIIYLCINVNVST